MQMRGQGREIWTQYNAYVGECMVQTYTQKKYFSGSFSYSSAIMYNIHISLHILIYNYIE